MIGINPSRSFSFLPFPTEIHFGSGMLACLPERLRSLQAKRVFLVTDPGIRAAGILDLTLATLSDGKIDCAVYDGVQPDSGSDLIEEAARQLRQSGCDAVVGLGGGSSLDTAKAVAMLATNPGSVLDYVGMGRVKNCGIPLIAIPTTAGTGSEVSLWSVFTNDKRNLKVAVGSVHLFPNIALCDPQLTMGLPAALTASTGMDALAHGIECYTNRACQPISASLALTAIALIGRNLQTAVVRPAETESRYAMLLASTMAGIAMNPTRLGLAHALAMPLGSWDLRIPHGVAIAVTLPRVMRFNYTAAPDGFASVARALGEPVEDLPIEEAAERAVNAVDNLARNIGIPTGLAQFGLRQDHIPTVVEEAMKSGNVPVNPRQASKEELSAILEKCL